MVSVRVVAIAGLLAGCNQVLSIPGTIDVACAADSTCPIDRPRCEVFSGVCRECVLDEHCPTNVCLLGGTCAADDQLLYATAAPPLGDCLTEATACDLSTALSLVTDTRFVVVLDRSTPYPLAEPISVSRRLILHGEGGTAVILDPTAPTVFAIDGGHLTSQGVSIAGTMAGTVIECRGGRLELANANITAGAATSFASLSGCTTEITDSAFADATGIGITSTDGTLRFERSTLRRAVGGAMQVSSAQISNAVIRLNGGPEASFILDLGSGSIVHTMISNNETSEGFGSTVNCGTARIDSSVLFENRAAFGIAADCESVQYTLSDFAIPGTGNFIGDPLINSGDADHVLPGSPCAGAGNPDLRPDRDIDGELRPLPAGSVGDCGADESP